MSGMIEEAPQAEQILGIFTVQEAVLQEERLTTEIPQPNWQGGNVPFHPGLIEAGELHRRSEGKAGGRRTNRLMILQKREDKRYRGEAANDLAQTKGRVRPKKCYLGSSLSPPPD